MIDEPWTADACHNNHNHRHHPAMSQQQQHVWRWARQGQGDNEDNEDTMVTPPRLRRFILFYCILYKF